jgi:hypothetical protein
MIIAEEQVETMLLILCDQLEAQDSQSMASSLSRRSSAANCGEDDAKTGRRCYRMDPVLKCYPNCPHITFNQDVLKGEQMVAVLSCNRLYSSHMSKLLMSLSNLQVPRLKQ